MRSGLGCTHPSMAPFITGSGLSLMDTHTGLAPRALRDIRAGQNAGGFAALDLTLPSARRPAV